MSKRVQSGNGDCARGGVAGAVWQLLLVGAKATLSAMGIAGDIAKESGWHAALAALAWQVDLGVTEVVGDVAVNRYDLPEAARPAAVTSAVSAPVSAPVTTPEMAAPRPAAGVVTPPPGASVGPSLDAVKIARAAAAGAGSLAALHEALARFEQCEIRRGAKSLVFADGNPQARVLILGEAPGREEDIAGRPFVGPVGQLLDAMFAAIGMARTSPERATALYVTNVLPWRPPQNRDPAPDEIAMMRPFVERHIALVDPDVVVLMGNTACDAVVGQRGINRLRGNWMQALGKPVLAMFHPAYLLREPAAKREAWADLLKLQAKLRV